MNNQYLIHSHACFVEFWNYLQIALNDQYAGLNFYDIILWFLDSCQWTVNDTNVKKKPHDFCPQPWISNRK